MMNMGVPGNAFIQGQIPKDGVGLARDSDIVADLFDERNEAVKWLVKHVIEVAHAHEPRRKICICGQAPSDFPDFSEFLVECGIDSLSLNPDVVVSTRLDIAKLEEGKIAGE